MSIVQYSEHCGVLVAQTLYCHMCEVSLFPSSGANNKPCQGKCVVKKKCKLKIFPSYKENTQNSEIDKNGKSLEEENDLQMEDRGMPKVLKTFYFNPNSLNIGCCL